MIQLHTLTSADGARKARKIRGRGDSSGRGSYSGRGRKGQRARAGGTRGLRYLGIRRMVLSTPKKRGFQSLEKKFAVVNVVALERYFQSGDTITPFILENKGIVKTARHGVKILADGTLTKKLSFEGCIVSKSAREKIEKVGGTIL